MERLIALGFGIFLLSGLNAIAEETPSASPPVADLCLSAASRPQDPSVLYFKANFGAAGDGRTDDYTAFRALAISLNGNREPKTIVFEEGTYLINRFKMACASGTAPNIVPANDHRDIIYQNMANVFFLGCPKARIKVAGGYHRRNDGVDESGRTVVCASGITPFRFRDSTNFTVQGFELEGGVREASTERGLPEEGAFGVMTSASTNYRLRQLNIHHFPGDGLYIGQGRSAKSPSLGVADRNVRITNVTSAHNGRQGITILQARGVVVRGSTFTDTGRTENPNYPGAEPMAGIDVEPNYWPDHGKFRVDVRSGNMEFINVRSFNNLGAQFAAQTNGDPAAPTSIVENITIDDSYFQAPADSYVDIAVLLSVPQGVVKNTKIFGSRGGLRANHGPISNRHKKISTEVHGSTLHSGGGYPAITDTRDHPFKITGSRFFANHASPGLVAEIRNAQAEISDSRFIINQLPAPETGNAPPSAFTRASVVLNAGRLNSNIISMVPRALSPFEGDVAHSPTSVVCNLRLRGGPLFVPGGRSYNEANAKYDSNCR